MLFDAIEYLRRIDAGQSYEVEGLTGGSINLTLRASKTENMADGRFPNRLSLIMKYAPPFVASVGEGLPMTTFRQVIEARALSLFCQDGKDALSKICSQSSVMVPELLYHDLDAHVLIMSDIGQLESLASVFQDLGGADIIDDTVKEKVLYYNQVGIRLGNFFAKLHSSKSLSAVLLNPERGPKFLENPYLADFAFENGVKPIKKNLELFQGLVSADEASVLYERAAKDNLIGIVDEERSVTLADCWTGSLLVSPQTTNVQETDFKIAVVDWEFATIGRGLNNDLAQLLARLALLHTAAACKKDKLHYIELEALASSLTKAYHKVSIKQNSPWTAGVLQDDAETFAELDENSLRTKMLRSAFLAHGIEIMRCAYSSSWNCQDPKCMTGSEHTADKHECVMIQAMVDRALWYFRHAKDDEHDFASVENSAVLQRARTEGRWLLDLF